MTTYAELKAQAEAMMAQAEAARQAELQTVVADIKAKIDAYGITAMQLGFVGTGQATARKSGKSKSTAPAKYKGPNGELWSGGLGRKPAWVSSLLAEGKNIEDYAIKAE